jgi:response regulator RpfG family c-di-GMP phosphodiesterase
LHAYLHDKCFGILKDGHGSHFDADVLDAFFRRTDDITEIQLRFSDRA